MYLLSSVFSIFVVKKLILTMTYFGDNDDDDDWITVLLSIFLFCLPFTMQSWAKTETEINKNVEKL